MDVHMRGAARGRRRWLPAGVALFASTVRSYAGRASVRIAAVIVLAMLFLTLLTLQEAELRRERGSFGYLLTTNNWATSQLEYELERFLGALDRFQLGAADMRGDDLMRRFDILWSRVPVLLQSEEAAEVRKVDGAVRLFKGVAATLADIEPDLHALIAGESDKAAEIRAALTKWRKPIRDVTNEVYTGGHFRRIAERARDGYRRAAVFQWSMLAVVAALAAFLGAEVLMSAKRAGNEKTARQAAERANLAKSTFLASMSHELRTPLNAIIGFSEIQARQLFGPVPERYLGYARDIHGSATHLLEVLNDILDMARTDAGRLDLNETLFDPLSALRSATRMVESSAQHTGVELILEPGPEPFALFADERLFRQIALNLLSNAIKFTPSSGTVRIRAALGPSGKAVLEVADTGIGIPDGVLSRITEPFFQADQSYARRHQGTGLGLSLVQGFTDLHDGTLRFESEFGVGTRAIVEFPAKRVRPDTASNQVEADWRPHATEA